MKGLVGFFDILGYQNFLANNSASESALKVLDIITDIPKKAKENTDSVAEKYEEYKEISDALSHLVFSDTIVFTLAYPETVDEKWINNAVRYMWICSAALVGEMFKNGLPIRGVIHEGEFITKDMCLAGKAIVDAYRLCEALNFSGLVFTESLGGKLAGSYDGSELTNDSQYLFTHLAPMKDGSEIKLVHPNWLSLFDGTEIDEFEKDAEDYVLRAFWAHQKDCPKSVDLKIYNTIKVMRKMAQNLQLAQSKEVAAPVSE